MTRVAELEAAGAPYVSATVVRCAPPTSVRAGDRAIVLADGTIEGFVGGACTDSTVRLQALRALETGEPVLLRILPGLDEARPSSQEGAIVVSNPCLSGGALELFIEPHLPAPRLAVAGESPVARALVDLAGRVGFAPRLGSVASAGDFGAVIASLGHDDEDALRRAVESGADYVALVASRRRGEAVLDTLRGEGFAEEVLARVRTPAGLDIGARTHEEIALSILAEMVAVRRSPAIPSAPGVFPVPPAVAGIAGDVAPLWASSPREAVDPVCGMTVVVGPATPTAGDHAFCCAGCRDAWLAREHAP